MNKIIILLILLQVPLFPYKIGSKLTLYEKWEYSNIVFRGCISSIDTINTRVKGMRIGKTDIQQVNFKIFKVYKGIIDTSKLFYQLPYYDDVNTLSSLDSGIFFFRCSKKSLLEVSRSKW